MINNQLNMTSTTTVSFLLFFSSLTSVLSITMAQGRAPHGLANEYPMAFSPSAYDFFHPNTQNKPNKESPCAESSCSPLPMAAQVEATDQAQRSNIATPHGGRPSLGAGGVAGIVFGFVFAVLLAMAVYYVVVTRRENTSRAKPAQPDA